MRLIVQKYGGTSVGTPERIRNVALRLVETQREGCQVVAVISAMAGVTDELVKLAHQVSPNPTERELDILLATGEHGATALTAMAVNALGGRAISLTGAQAGILTDRNHTKARIANISPSRFMNYCRMITSSSSPVFRSDSRRGNNHAWPWRLGLDGNCACGALNADICQIFTDVDGVFTCDPRVVTDAKKLDEVAYDELLEMASAGSKVMQSRAVEFAKKFGIEFEVRSSLRTSAGTIAKEETPSMEDVVIRGISLERHQQSSQSQECGDEPGNAGRIFSNIAAAHIIVDMIVQNASIGGTTDVSFTIHEDELEKCPNDFDARRQRGRRDAFEHASGVAKLSVVGIGMRSHSGVAARMFECLGRGGINIQLVSTSEIKIAVIIDEKDAERAAQLIHAEFGLARLMPVVSAIKPLA
jgi:aspartate kinase